MDDDRLWGFEQSLWAEASDNHRETVDPAVVKVLPRPPCLSTGNKAIKTVAQMPV